MKPAPPKSEVYKRRQAVQDDGVHVQVQNPVQFPGQQQRRSQPVINLERVPPRHREPLKQAVGHLDQGAAVRRAKDLVHLVLVRPGQVRVEHVEVIPVRPAVAEDGGHALGPQGDKFPVDGKQKVHGRILAFCRRMEGMARACSGVVRAASIRPLDA